MTDTATSGPVGVVLCGGASRRMGRDKATLGPPDRPMAARVATALRSAGATEVVLVGGDCAALAGHGDVWVPDDRPGDGPLAAIATAARHRPGRDLLVCACDLPLLGAAALAPLVDALADGAAAAVCDVDGRPQWSVVAVAAGLAAALDGPDGPLARGERSLRGGLGGLARRLPPAPGATAALRDVDRPEDLPADLRD